jgi:Flp pilus assembly protein TadB
MLETAAALAAGIGLVVAVLVIAVPAPATEDRVRRAIKVRLEGEQWLVLQVLVGLTGGAVAVWLTGLPVLSIAGAVGGAAVVRSVSGARSRAREVARQDAVIDAVRMLRQLLETGASSVHMALAALGERGPAPLRAEFRHIASTTVGRRHAWSEARERISEPLFDMLAAAVLIHGPSGGELAPLFADLEVSVSGAHEVEREARALQAQARSAAAIIVSLPVAFLVTLSALHSPYLDAFRTVPGELFLIAMLAIMGASYLWMRRLLDLPGLQRVRLSDA